MFQFKNRKIIVDIITIFISLLLVTTGSIIFYSYQQNKESFLKMGKEMVESDHQQIIDKLTHFLSPDPFIKTTSQFVEDGVLTLDELRSLSSFMHVMLTAYPEFNSVYLADDEGNVYFENRYHSALFDDQMVHLIKDDAIPEGTYYISQVVKKIGENRFLLDVIFKNHAGETLSSYRDKAISFQVRTRAWYAGAKKHPGSTWVDVSQRLGAEKETLILARAVMVNQQFRGVIAADINLNQLDRFLDELATHHESILIVNENSKIIARSGTENTSFDLHSICKRSSEEVVQLDQDNDEWMVHCTDYVLNADKKWKIITLMPMSYFISDLKQVNTRNLIFSFWYLLAGLILVVYFARKISKPIMQLANETREISQFHFEKQIDLTTHIYEINVLLEAVHAFRRTAHSFSKYIPKIMVEKLLQYKMIAKPGGQKKELTILFSDVEQFTQIAEQLDPSDLMIHVSEYLEKITSIIHHHSGNVDKYIGDAVMAFWGAPLQNIRHTHDALYAVLACRDAIHQLNTEWAHQHKPIFPTRFGLASGTVVVGNVGSTDRLNYTVLGDSVNLAARLQTLNKEYGTSIIVNEAIYQTCKEEFVFRVLDRVKVKGKTQSVLIYELMGAMVGMDERVSVTEAQLTLSVRCNRAFDALEKEDYDTAFQLFTEIKTLYPDDVPAQIHLSRMRDEE